MSIQRAIFSLIKDIAPYGIVTKLQEQKDLRIQQMNQQPPLPLPPIYIHEDPPIFDQHGKQLLIYYLQDTIFEHLSHSLTYGHPMNGIFWDRGDCWLKHHIYTHKNVLHLNGHPETRYAMMIESEAIVPEDYQVWDDHPALYKEFDAVFTNSKRMLEKIPNSKFIPASTVWVGTTLGTGILSGDAYQHKTKNVSMLCSQKCLCRMHELRHRVASQLQKDGSADIFGTFCGGDYCDLSAPLEDYRFSVVMENQIEPFLFTEKLLNCFATMTIPIYVGATDICQFFNTEGIIAFTAESTDDIPKIMKQCDEGEYKRRIDAVIDNFKRVQSYLTMEQYLLEKYGSLLDYLRGENK